MKTSKCLLNKKSLYGITLALLALIAVIYLFYPRNLATLAHLPPRDTATVTLHGIFTDHEENHVQTTLTEEQTDAFFRKMESTYVFRAPFAKKVTLGKKDYVGYVFEISHAETDNSVPPFIEYFTVSTISVDGVSYHIYSNEFYEWFSQFLKSAP